MVDSKLDKILKDLNPLAQRGAMTRFLTNAEDVDTLSDMVEDIRDAMMQYQVCPFAASALALSNIHTRHPYNRISSVKTACSS